MGVFGVKIGGGGSGRGCFFFFGSVVIRALRGSWRDSWRNVSRGGRVFVGFLDG